MSEDRQYHPVPVPGQEPAPDVWVVATQDEMECMKSVADAIILERAARVMRRRHDFRARETLERFRYVAWVLEYEAQQLRSEADRSV